MSMKQSTRDIANTIKSANVDNEARKAMAEAFFLTLDDKRVIRREFLGACGVTKKVNNLMSGKEIIIAIDTPIYCDPSSESYWSM